MHGLTLRLCVCLKPWYECVRLQVCKHTQRLSRAAATPACQYSALRLAKVSCCISYMCGLLWFVAVLVQPAQPPRIICPNQLIQHKT
jgi:hypothetical protein